ncbi:MAG: DUF2141 domain-containing protein [Saonia sp.]
MKTLGLILGLFFTGLVANAQTAEGVTVTVTIENILNENGKILVALHTSETFMKGKGVDNFETDAKKGAITLTFENVAPGTYAISTIHDENNNRRMDFDPSGMPGESYGMSGNEMAMGPPSFVDAQFEVTDEDLEFNIRF